VTDERPRVPVAVFRSAEVGDWSLWRVAAGTAKSGECSDRLSLSRVERVEGDRVWIVRGMVDMNRGGPKEPPREFSRSEPPGIHEFFEIAAAMPIRSVKVEDETKTIDGLTFVCKKLTFSATLSKVQAWFAASIPLVGVVASATTADNWVKGKKKQFAVAHQIVGFGRGATVVWGTAPPA
jgi:hypothetical protein